MIDAAVGFQCPDCVRQGSRETRQHELPYGGRRVADPRRTTVVLIAVNVVVFVLVSLRSGLSDLLSLTPAGICLSVSDPGSYYPSATQAVCEVLADGEWVPGVATGRWWQVLTSMFLHTSLWHLGMNMLALWFVGQNLEVVLGRARFLAVYLVSGLFGSAAVMWLSDPASATLGASGAVFGLFGALLLLAWRVRGNVRQLLYVMAINAAISFIPGVSWQGHLGGFVGGVVVTAIILFAPRTHRAQVQWSGIALATAATLAAIALRAVLLL